jgi:hypothetical protein
MALETIDDLVEQIADWSGFYGAHVEGETGLCRCCFTAELRDRIRAAANVEAIMARVTISPQSDAVTSGGAADG